MDDNVAIIITPLKNCISAQTCLECSEVSKTTSFDCGWCPVLMRCSDGLDRHRQEWINRDCHEEADLSACISTTSASFTSGQIGGVTVGIIVLILLLLAVIAVALIFVYGYKRPSSRVGVFMIENRNVLSRIKSSSKSSTSYDVKKEALVEEDV